jgi:hypothetical protein
LTRLAHTPVIFFVAALSLAVSAVASDSKPKAAPKPSAAPAKPAPVAAPAQLSDAEKALRERVAAYWGFRANTNLHACYPFYESSFRGKYTADQFATDFRRLNRFAPEFMGVEGVSIDAAGARATVKVKLRTHPDVLQGEELISAVEETWLLENGVWNKAGELTFPNI